MRKSDSGARGERRQVSGGGESCEPTAPKLRRRKANPTSSHDASANRPTASPPGTTEPVTQLNVQGAGDGAEGSSVVPVEPDLDKRLFMLVNAFTSIAERITEALKKPSIASTNPVSLDEDDPDRSTPSCSAEGMNVSTGDQASASEVGTSLVLPSGFFQTVSMGPDKPKFDGTAGTSAVRFLEKLEEYFRRIKIPGGSQLAIARDCMVGNAANWMSIYSGQWKVYADFKTDVLKDFWSRAEQTKIRREISTAQWHPHQKLSMVNHLAYHVSNARLLKPEIPEELLVPELVAHFPGDIQSLWWSSEKATLAQLAEHLRVQGDLYHPCDLRNPRRVGEERSISILEPEPFATTLGSSIAAADRPARHGEGVRSRNYTDGRSAISRKDQGNGREGNGLARSFPSRWRRPTRLTRRGTPMSPEGFYARWDGYPG